MKGKGNDDAPKTRSKSSGKKTSSVVDGDNFVEVETTRNGQKESTNVVNSDTGANLTAQSRNRAEGIPTKSDESQADATGKGTIPSRRDGQRNVAPPTGDGEITAATRRGQSKRRRISSESKEPGKRNMPDVVTSGERLSDKRNLAEKPSLSMVQTDTAATPTTAPAAKGKGLNSIQRHLKSLYPEGDQLEPMTKEDYERERKKAWEKERERRRLAEAYKNMPKPKTPKQLARELRAYYFDRAARDAKSGRFPVGNSLSSTPHPSGSSSLGSQVLNAAAQGQTPHRLAAPRVPAPSSGPLSNASVGGSRNTLNGTPQRFAPGNSGRQGPMTAPGSTRYRPQQMMPSLNLPGTHRNATSGSSFPVQKATLGSTALLAKKEIGTSQSLTVGQKYRNGPSETPLQIPPPILGKQVPKVPHGLIPHRSISTSSSSLSGSLSSAALKEKSMKREPAVVHPMPSVSTSKPTSHPPILDIAQPAKLPPAPLMVTPIKKASSTGSEDSLDTKHRSELRKSTRKTSTVPSYVQKANPDSDDDEADPDSEFEDTESEIDSESEEKMGSKTPKTTKNISADRLRKKEKQEEKKRQKKVDQERRAWDKYVDRKERERIKEEKRKMRENEKLEREKKKQDDRELRSDKNMCKQREQKNANILKADKKFHDVRQKHMKERIKGLTDQVRDATEKEESVHQVKIKRSELAPPRSKYTDAQMFDSCYFSALVTGFRSSPNNLKVIQSFARKASKHPDDFYMTALRDPYYEGGFYRGYSTQRSLGSSGEFDFGIETILDANDDIRVVSDKWIAEVQHGLPSSFKGIRIEDGFTTFAEKLGIGFFGPIPWRYDRNDIDVDQRLERLSHFVHKFLLIINMWKRSNKDAKHLRVVRYFFYIVEVVVLSNSYDAQNEHPNDFLPTCKMFRCRLVRDMLMWLPIHVGDLMSQVHDLRPAFYDLARQLFAVILDEWEPVMGLRIEELAYLHRIRLAALRLECFDARSTNPIVDVLPFCRPADVRGATGKNLEEGRGSWKKPRTVYTRSSTLMAPLYCKDEGHGNVSGRTKPRCYRSDCAKALSQTSMVDQLPHCHPADHRSGFGRNGDRLSREKRLASEKKSFKNPPSKYRSRSCFTRFRDTSNIRQLRRREPTRLELFHISYYPAELKKVTDERVPYNFVKRD